MIVFGQIESAATGKAFESATAEVDAAAKSDDFAIEYGAGPVSEEGTEEAGSDSNKTDTEPQGTEPDPQGVAVPPLVSQIVLCEQSFDTFTQNERARLGDQLARSGVAEFPTNDASIIASDKFEFFSQTVGPRRLAESTDPESSAELDLDNFDTQNASLVRSFVKLPIDSINVAPERKDFELRLDIVDEAKSNQPKNGTVDASGVVSANPLLVLSETTQEMQIDGLQLQTISATQIHIDSKQPTLPTTALTANLGTPDVLGPIVPRIAHQIGMAMFVANENQIELRLDPPELGNVKINIELNGNSVRANILVERTDIIDLMRRNSEVLVRELQALGFNKVDLKFQSGQNLGQSNDRHFRNVDRVPANEYSDDFSEQQSYSVRKRNSTKTLDVRL